MKRACLRPWLMRKTVGGWTQQRLHCLSSGTLLNGFSGGDGDSTSEWTRLSASMAAVEIVDGWTQQRLH